MTARLVSRFKTAPMTVRLAALLSFVWGLNAVYMALVAFRQWPMLRLDASILWLVGIPLAIALLRGSGGARRVMLGLVFLHLALLVSFIVLALVSRVELPMLSVGTVLGLVLVYMLHGYLLLHRRTRIYLARAARAMRRNKTVDVGRSAFYYRSSSIAGRMGPPHRVQGLHD
jgi:hypothetical protein